MRDREYHVVVWTGQQPLLPPMQPPLTIERIALLAAPVPTGIANDLRHMVFWAAFDVYTGCRSAAVSKPRGRYPHVSRKTATAA